MWQIIIEADFQTQNESKKRLFTHWSSRAAILHYNRTVISTRFNPIHTQSAVSMLENSHSAIQPRDQHSTKQLCCKDSRSRWTLRWVWVSSVCCDKEGQQLTYWSECWETPPRAQDVEGENKIPYFCLQESVWKVKNLSYGS